MPYLGNVPAEAYTNTVKDSFNGDGSTTAFTLSQPSTTNNLRVVVENVIQDPTVAYSCSGTTLTFTSAPPSGTANIYAVHLGPATMTAVPPTEITNATTYTSALTVQGAFTSPGIDDNATSTAITINSSGQVLVGKTVSDTTTSGNTVYAGIVSATMSGDPAIFANRTQAGSIIELQKNGTTVGSIGTESTWGSGPQFLGSNSRGFIIANPNTSVNEIIPNVDTVGKLGNSSNRWADLYLSGSVYLGGTGSANALDDYEEGTWTPTFSSGGASFSYQNQAGTYVKVGGIVHAQFYLNATASGTTSNACYIASLPFTSANISAQNQWGCACWFTGVDVQPLVNNANTTVTLWKQGAVAIATAAEMAGNRYLVGHVSYRTS